MKPTTTTPKTTVLGLLSSGVKLVIQMQLTVRPFDIAMIFQHFIVHVNFQMNKQQQPQRAIHPHRMKKTIFLRFISGA